MTRWLWWRYRLEYVVFRLLLCVWQALPPRHCTLLAHALAWIVHRLLPGRLSRSQVARENLARAFGEELPAAETERIVYAMWVHLFRMLGEIAQLPRKLHDHNILQIVKYTGRVPAIRALHTGRPIMFLGGHFGNWEVGSALFGRFGYPMGVVARDLENPLLHEWFLEFRKFTGHYLIGKKGFDEMVEEFRHGGRVALLGDQDAGRGGMFVDFFGHPASTAKTIALLAREYDALICVGCSWRLETPVPWVQYEMCCEEVIDPREFTNESALREITQRYTAALERVVRRTPEQYFWLHRRWKTPPDARAKKREARRKAG